MYLLWWPILVICGIAILEPSACLPEMALTPLFNEPKCPLYCYSPVSYFKMSGKSKEEVVVTGTRLSTDSTVESSCKCSFSGWLWTKFSETVLARTVRATLQTALDKEKGKAPVEPSAPSEVGLSSKKKGVRWDGEAAGSSDSVTASKNEGQSSPNGGLPVKPMDPARAEARKKGPTVTLRSQYTPATCKEDCAVTYGVAVFGEQTIHIAQANLLGTTCHCPVAQAFVNKLTELKLDVEVYRTWHKTPKYAKHWLKVNKISWEEAREALGPEVVGRPDYTLQTCQEDCNASYGFAVFGRKAGEIAKVPTTQAKLSKDRVLGKNICHCSISEKFLSRLKQENLNADEYRAWHKSSPQKAKRWLAIYGINMPDTPKTTPKTTPVKLSPTSTPERPRPSKSQASTSRHA